MAGLASSSLERDVSSCCPLSCRHDHHCFEWMFVPFEVTYCSISALAFNPMETLRALQLNLVTGRLKNGMEVPCTASQEGVRMRPVKGTAGISTLNPGEAIPIPVWQGLVVKLSEKFNLWAFNYDWRRWGDEVYAEEMVDNFKKLVEKDCKRSGHKCAVKMLFWVVFSLTAALKVQ